MFSGGGNIRACSRHTLACRHSRFGVRYERLQQRLQLLRLSALPCCCRQQLRQKQRREAPRWSPRRLRLPGRVRRDQLPQSNPQEIAGGHIRRRSKVAPSAPETTLGISSATCAYVSPWPVDSTDLHETRNAPSQSGRPTITHARHAKRTRPYRPHVQARTGGNGMPVKITKRASSALQSPDC